MENVWKRLISLVLIIITLRIKISIASTVEEEKYTYNAAVVAYHPLDDPTSSPEEKLKARTKSYIDLLKTVDQDLDIIVFPESMLIPPDNKIELSSEVPEPFKEFICNSTNGKYKEYLKNISCAAIEFNVTIVINVVEKENCTSTTSTGVCPDSGFVYYNTDIAFNEDGVVSGRYRKWNLYGETNISVPSNVELVTITTRKNDTFGIFTCFDILFSQPALNLTKDLNVKNVIFPTNWVSELPYLTALQAQQMWAHENNVNLLAAGASNPQIGAGGSGIFVGRKGPLDTSFTGGHGGTKILIKRVPRLEIENNPYLKNLNATDDEIDELAKYLDDVHLLVDATLEDHTSVIVNTTQTNISEKICNGKSNELCCQFNIIIHVNETIQGQDKYVYRMAVYSGTRSYNAGTALGGIESCAVIACLNESLASCGQRFSNYSNIYWPITFESITVSALFPSDNNRIQYPNSVLTSLRPILPQYTVWEKEEIKGSVKRTHILNRPQNRLLTFGIFGRNFIQDIPVTPDASAKMNIWSISSLLCLGVIISLYGF
ncbi:hypothetical protein JTB14_036001 [Gonioctena quinquepunctata]|nr:hypothetical protein JTB14_036001 [Gonioctena quinquepunctata]